MKYERDLYLMQQIYATIFTLANKMQMNGDKALQVLTTRQMMAMIAIIHLPDGQSTHSNIAKILGTTRQSEKQLIALMEQKGYVISVPSQEDKRASNVEITSLGRQATITCAERSFGFMAELFAQFTTQDLESLWGFLRKLYHYDGDEQECFEKNANYVTEEDITESQLQAIEKFERSRAKAEKEVNKIEKESK